MEIYLSKNRAILSALSFFTIFIAFIYLGSIFLNAAHITGFWNKILSTIGVMLEVVFTQKAPLLTRCFLVICFSMFIISAVYLFRSIKLCIKKTPPYMVLGDNSLKYLQKEEIYIEIPYSDILEMSSKVIQGGRSINILKKDGSEINVNIGSVSASAKEIFQYIVAFRDDLKPLGGWDWSIIKSGGSNEKSGDIEKAKRKSYRVAGLCLALSIALLAYGVYGIATDNLVIPTKRGAMALYGYSAWVMFLALLCCVIYILAGIASQLGMLFNEKSCVIIRRYSLGVGAALFVSSLALSLYQEQKDYVCANSEIQRTSNEDGSYILISFNRYCALHNPYNEKTPLLQISILPSYNPNLPDSIGNAARLGSNDISRMYWNKNTPVVEYLHRKNKSRKDGPYNQPNSPLSVEFIEQN